METRQSAGRRVAIVAAALAVLVVAFLALRGGGEDDSAGSHPAAGSAAETPTATEAPAATETQTQTQTEPAPEPVPVVRVVGAKPQGGVQKLTVAKGDRVRFRVDSDTADEIHVHGYDLAKDVTAGGSVSFSFPATIDGRFEVELESRGEQIAQLDVEP
jgi:hypothetical protein